MICKQCQQDIPDGKTTCPYCGTFTGSAVDAEMKAVKTAMIILTILGVLFIGTITIIGALHPEPRYFEESTEETPTDEIIEFLNAMDIEDHDDDFNDEDKALDAAALYEKGRSFAQGDIAKRDYVEAAKYYLRSAEMGYAPAQFSMGSNYREGRGVEKNVTEAKRWFRAAAEQGDVRSQYNLGSIYSSEKNYDEAIKWYAKAAEQGDVYAKDALQECEAKMKKASEKKE